MTINKYIESLTAKKVIADETLAAKKLLNICDELTLDALLYHTINHGIPPYGVRITYPLSFLAENIDYVKIVLAMRRN